VCLMKGRLNLSHDIDLSQFRTSIAAGSLIL
jgi:hypothetical protein